LYPRGRAAGLLAIDAGGMTVTKLNERQSEGPPPWHSAAPKSCLRAGLC